MTDYLWFGILAIGIIALTWYSLRCAGRSFDKTTKRGDQ